MYCHIDILGIDGILKKLLFDLEDGEKTVELALSVFVPQPDEDDFVTQYRAHIENRKLFKLFSGPVALGSSFRLAAKWIAYVREKLFLGDLRACDHGKVLSFNRGAAAACLQNSFCVVNLSSVPLCTAAIYSVCLFSGLTPAS